MKFITGKDRNQTEFFCSEQAVGQDNEIRLIDLFMSAIKMEDHGFDMSFIDNGRPAYHPSALLRLYIYGYLNVHKSLVFTLRTVRFKNQFGFLDDLPLVAALDKTRSTLKKKKYRLEFKHQPFLSVLFQCYQFHLCETQLIYTTLTTL